MKVDASATLAGSRLRWRPRWRSRARPLWRRHCRFKLAFLVASLLLAPLAVAQTPDPSSDDLRDDRGVVIRPATAPRRIVSLLPSLTESVCALEACERLVGTDRYSNWPASVRALPKLGGIDDAQIERIVALKPDLVLVSKATRVVARLESLGIRVAVLDADDYAQTRRSLLLLGRILGERAAAERVWSGIEQAIVAAAARVPPALRAKRVYFEVDATPYAAGPESFIGETLFRLGLGNAVPRELGPFPRLNPELVVRLQPDLVMATAQAIETMPSRPGWAALHALRERQTCAFPPERYELLVRPGPRIGEAAGVIVDCLLALPKSNR